MRRLDSPLSFMQMPHQFGLPMAHELVVDNFAGGGGASLGIEMAIGRSVDLAINHDPEAVALHEANHPYTHHYCESVWDVDPIAATGGRPVGLAWFSPDCKDHSKAKGGKPRSKKIRGLAWVALKWVGKVRPRLVFLENVEEFAAWSRLVAKRDPATGRVIKLDGTVAKPGERVPLQEQHLVRDERRLGEYFGRFVSLLRSHGYQVEWRELRACDFGAPTIRKRLFLIARCDGKPIVWPKATHGIEKGQKPLLTAAECIDWSIPAPSIFERKRPLAENTLKRVARGIERFVINAQKPFIVTCNHAGDGFRGQGVDEPFKTITSARDAHGLVMPHLIGIDHQGSGASSAWDINQAMTTVTAENRHALVASTLIQTGYGERKGQAPRVLGIDKPLGTVVAGGQKHALVSAFLAKHYSGVVGQPVNQPASTITSVDHHSLVAAHIQRDFGASIGSAAGEPLGTVTAGGSGKSALITSNLVKLRGTCRDGQPIAVPMPTVTAGGLHLGEVRTLLQKYSGKVTEEQDGLVTVDGAQYFIADIGMRMLTPRELYRAQSFPDTYKIEIEYNGKPLSKSAQVRMCGNSVSPLIAKALVAANYCDQMQLEPAKELAYA